MGLLVCYSLYEPSVPRPDLARQLATSLGTLRRVSPRTDVVLFSHGRPGAGVVELCRRHRVELHESEAYAHRLRRLCPDGAPALVHHGRRRTTSW